MHEHLHHIQPVIEQAGESVPGLSWLLFLTVLSSGFLGSFHCVAMCGGLVTSVAPDRTRQVAYQLGRLVSYSGIGAIAGAFGHAILSRLQMPLLSWTVAGSLGLALFIVGFRTFMGKGVHISIPYINSIYSYFFKRNRFAARDSRSQYFTALMTGALSVFLPCGYLYGFFAAAIATKSMVVGSVFMASFWLGTMPALSLSSLAVHKALKPLSIRAPRLLGLVFIGLGVLTIIAKFQHVHSN